MLIKKITHGFVTQIYDTQTEKFVCQEFTAGDLVEVEDEKGKPVNPEMVSYLNFDMVQPRP